MNRPKPHRRVVVMSLAVVVSLHLGLAETAVWAQQDALPDTVLATTASPSYPQLVPASDPSLQPDRQALPDRWRYLDPNGLPVVGYSLLDPYHQNPLKGDFAVFGQNTFAVLTLLGTPAALFSSQEGVDPQFNNRLIGAFELFNGLTVFKPKDWSLKG